MTAAPVILFAFNRPDLLRSCLKALCDNQEAERTPLYIYVDGARNDKEAEKVAEVLEVARTAKGFASVKVVSSGTNKGLGASIIAGVSEVMNLHGRAIVIEDDLVVTGNFLAYMNQFLDKYEDEKQVFSICGYSLDVNPPESYTADTYFCHRSSSWGWGSWKDRWESVDWNPSEESIIRYGKAFNRWGGSDCKGMLLGWKKRKNTSWAIRFCFSQFIQDKPSLFPVRSLVNPDAGFSGDGTNCRKYSRFRHLLSDGLKREFSYPDSLEVNPAILQNTLKYHSVGKRIWSRLMYLINR